MGDDSKLWRPTELLLQPFSSDEEEVVELRPHQMMQHGEFTTAFSWKSDGSIKTHKTITGLEQVFCIIRQKTHVLAFTNRYSSHDDFREEETFELIKIMGGHVISKEVRSVGTHPDSKVTPTIN